MKWIVAFAVLLVALLAIVWNMGPNKASKLASSPAKPTQEAPTALAEQAPATSFKSKPKTIAKAVEIDSDSKLLDPTSEAFSHELDVGIPDGFRAKLADCERKDMDPDAKISISYQLHIEAGIVSASQVRVQKSDLDNPDLEQCMVVAIQNARWEAANLPNFSEEQDLFIRMRSLDKYLDENAQKASKDANREQ